MRQEPHSPKRNPESEDERREELAEATEHREDADRHRREAASDRAEAAADRRERDPLEAAGNEVEAGVHDVAARGHEQAARHDEREAAAHTPTTEGALAGSDGHAIFGDEPSRRFRARWDDIQASFIDEPRRAVAAADELVREATEALHAAFERDRRQLEGAWDRGDEVSTEDLRVTLQRYRSFFERLLTL